MLPRSCVQNSALSFLPNTSQSLSVCTCVDLTSVLPASHWPSETSFWLFPSADAELSWPSGHLPIPSTFACCPPPQAPGTSKGWIPNFLASFLSLSGKHNLLQRLEVLGLGGYPGGPHPLRGEGEGCSEQDVK